MLTNSLYTLQKISNKKLNLKLRNQEIPCDDHPKFIEEIFEKYSNLETHVQNTKEKITDRQNLL